MAHVSLDDKYAATEGHVYMNGNQALVRLPIMQAKRDRAAGLKTAGFISGYRGSPLGIYDYALWDAAEFLKENDIRFQPGVNEDLAATAVLGSQQVGLISKSDYDGIFSIWYGKGPGVDRSGDAMKHGSFNGAARHGGVLALCGDDHAARSSTIAHQSDHALIHYAMPVFNPAHIQDYLDLGLAAFAMSRFSGTWVGFKCITDTLETSARVDIALARQQLFEPEDYMFPPDGLNIRLGVPPLAAEARQIEQRLTAARAFARRNRLDHQIFGPEGDLRLGIVTTGKGTLDVLEALRAIGLDEARAARLGIGIYKVAMVWPLEKAGIRAFAQRCDEVFVVEEKRPIIEDQLAHILYNLRADKRPILTGKRDENGAPLVSEVGELVPDTVVEALYRRLVARGMEEEFRAQWERLPRGQDVVEITAAAAGLVRLPSFCAGCPHNTSTRVPEGSIATGGIGCHGLAVWMPERNTVTLYHMGGEGAAWVGLAPFVEKKHIFQNMGDGTFFHSGLLAIRSCVAANTNITFKILLNWAVSMTGGQPIEGEEVFDGHVSAPDAVAQLRAEGVKKIVLVSDDPGRHDPKDFPKDVAIRHRDDLNEVHKELRELPGVTAIVYDQACSTERRRKRKRGEYPTDDKRVFIDTDVCEGCGDCNVQSNCVAVEPFETDLGRKRQINQSVCNQDFSCVKGLCPSYITVEGGSIRKATPVHGHSTVYGIDRELPDPTLPALDTDNVYSIIVAGIGGNGVVTTGAILGMAAHLDKLGVSVLDLSGLAQRNGPVTSHIRLTRSISHAYVPRIPEEQADAVIGCDLVVAASQETLGKMARDRTKIVYNYFVAPTSAFANNPNLDFQSSRLTKIIGAKAGTDALSGVDATKIAETQLGNAIGGNMLLVGFAWQKGYIPLTLDAIEEAIRLNGASVDLNLTAFRMGRIAAVDPSVTGHWMPKKAKEKSEMTLDEFIAMWEKQLEDFDGAPLAQRYRTLVDRVADTERGASGAPGTFTRAVAGAYAKTLYYKDEYEVARLFTEVNGGIYKKLSGTFDGNYKIRFNMAPPIISKRGPDGRERKRQFGPWVFKLFHVLAWMKGVRGTPFDIFGYTAHRRMERKLGYEYEALVDQLLPVLNAENADQLATIARAYEDVKGYGIVKEGKLETVREKVRKDMASLDDKRLAA